MFIHVYPFMFQGQLTLRWGCFMSFWATKLKRGNQAPPKSKSRWSICTMASWAARHCPTIPAGWQFHEFPHKRMSENGEDPHSHEEHWRTSFIGKTDDKALDFWVPYFQINPFYCHHILPKIICIVPDKSLNIANLPKICALHPQFCQYSPWCPPSWHLL